MKKSRFTESHIVSMLARAGARRRGRQQHSRLERRIADPNGRGFERLVHLLLPGQGVSALSLPADANVVLEVYSVTGQKVATLVSGPV